MGGSPEGAPELSVQEAATLVFESEAGLLLCNGARVFDKSAEIEGFRTLIGTGESWQKGLPEAGGLNAGTTWGLHFPYRGTLSDSFSGSGVKHLALSTINLAPNSMETVSLGLNFRPKMPRASYERAIEAIKEEIRAGEYYELNLCMRFETQAIDFEPVESFGQILQATRARFAALLKDGDDVYLCASPERFFKVGNGLILAEPIKGTAPRVFDEFHERQIVAELARSEKERAENLMIVDLMRHDLSHFCEPSSIQVRELWGVRTYPTVHQMTSVIVGIIEAETTLGQMIDHLAPAGSMTGAPKSRVMEAIKTHETTERGLYSGSIGFVGQDDHGELLADMNVVIRTLHFNQRTKKLQFHVGGAITLLSQAESEWAECLHKAEALVKSLGCTIDA